MRVLGVTLSDPTDRAQFEQAIRETLRARSSRRLNVSSRRLVGGAKPATAYFALTRFVLPNALYHMQVWGLLCSAEVWAETDDALTVLRGTLPARPARPPRAPDRAPRRVGAAAGPRRPRHPVRCPRGSRPRRGPVEPSRRRRGGHAHGHATASYRRCGLCQAPPVGSRRHGRALHRGGGQPLAEACRRSEARDRQGAASGTSSAPRCGPFNAVPWVPELTIDHLEWDVLVATRIRRHDGRYARRRLDHPADGFAYRGRRMEYAVVDAIRECVPPGVLSISSQPAPERIPPDHAERCRRDHTSPDGWKRADIALAFSPAGPSRWTSAQPTRSPPPPARRGLQPLTSARRKMPSQRSTRPTTATSCHSWSTWAAPSRNVPLAHSSRSHERRRSRTRPRKEHRKTLEKKIQRHPFESESGIFWR